MRPKRTLIALKLSGVTLLVLASLLWPEPASAQPVIWERASLATDGTHPARTGEEKGGAMLLNFFLTSPATTPWFCAQEACAAVDIGPPGLGAWEIGAPSGDSQITGTFKASSIVITTTNRLAGAIGSLTWNGEEFINSFDHGRELQSASSFNNWGECFNPTEAGSASDGTGLVSTSILQSLSASGNVLETQTQMAFWLRPGETSPSCGDARNTSQLSDHLLNKKVTIGFQGIANVIEHDMTFTVPSSYNSAVFEALTGYMPPDFSKFWTYDPKTRDLAALSDGPGEQNLPVILATPDGNYAMGVYSPGLPQSSFPGAGYGRWRFDTLPGPGNATVKWNCVYRESPVPAQSYSYKCYSIVGTLADVKDGMDELNAYFNPNQSGVGGIAELPDVTASPGETSRLSAPNVALILAIAAAVVIALTSTAWYAKRRWGG